MTREAAGTIEFCRGLDKPYRVVDAAVTSMEEAARPERAFVQGGGSATAQYHRTRRKPRGERLRLWVSNNSEDHFVVSPTLSPYLSP